MPAQTDAPRLTPAHIAASSPLALAAMVAIDGKRAPLWSHQREILRAVQHHRHVMVLKARQLGVTWAIAILALWWAISHPAETVLVVSIGERESTDVLRRIRRLYASLPASVRAAFPIGQDNATRLEIEHPEGPGAIISLPSSSNAGRGQTVHLLIGDERPKWPQAEEQEAALLPAAADVGRVVMVGTANGMDGYYDRWEAAPGNGWHPIFVGATARPGRSEQWVAVEREKLGDLGAQEFPMSPEEAFLSSGRCAFSLQDLAELRQKSCEPASFRGQFSVVDGQVFASESERGDWWVWQWPERDRDYLVVADVCGGQGGEDFSAAAVYDTTSWDQVAAFHGRPEPDVFGRELMRAGYLYSGANGPALLAPEANGHGAGVIATLKDHFYPRVYQRESFDQRENKKRVELGWLTTSKSRFLMVSALQQAIRERTLGIRDAAAVVEMRRFIWRETPTGGRFEADAGAHDDRVLTHAIAAAVLAHSMEADPMPAPTIMPRRKPRVSVLTGY